MAKEPKVELKRHSREDIATIKLSPTDIVEVIDPNNITPVYSDVFTELRLNGNVVILSLGSLIIEGETDTKSIVQVVSRLRINLDTARSIQQGLDRILQSAQVPPNETVN